MDINHFCNQKDDLHGISTSVLAVHCFTIMQWRNRRGGGHLTSDREISADLSGKKEAREKGQNGEEKNENCKRESGKLKMEGGKSSKMRRGLFFFFFFFFFAFHFSKRRKFVLGVPKWKFSTGKKDFTPGKNQEK